MAKNETVTGEQYEGPGRLTSALGASTVYGVGGSVAGAIAGAAGGAVFIKKDGKVVGHVVDSLKLLEVEGVSNPKTVAIAASALIGSVIVGNIGRLTGLVKGWKNSNKGKAQFEAKQEQLGMATTLIKQQQEELGVAKAELHTERKRFTDTIQPRTQHGSHAEAHLADQAQAAHAEAAR